MKTRYIKIHNKFYIQIFKNNTWTFFHYNKYNEKMLYFNSIFNKLECSWELINIENIKTFIKYDTNLIIDKNVGTYILLTNNEIYCAAMCAGLKLILEEKIITVDNDFYTFNA
jgi:hypothetical protein